MRYHLLLLWGEIIDTVFFLHLHEIHEHDIIIIPKPIYILCLFETLKITKTYKKPYTSPTSSSQRSIVGQNLLPKDRSNELWRDVDEMWCEFIFNIYLSYCYHLLSKHRHQHRKFSEFIRILFGVNFFIGANVMKFGIFIRWKWLW